MTPEPGAGRRLLIVYDGVPPWRQGGAETRLWAIARGLAQRGWQVTWLGYVAADAPSQMTREGVTVIAIGHEPRPRAGRRRGAGSVLRLLWRLQRGPWPDADVVLLGQIPWIHFFVARRRTARPVPIVVDCWELWGAFWQTYYGRVAGGIGRRVERAVLRRADLLACISGQTQAAALSQGVDPQRVVLLPNGVDLALVGEADAPRDAREITYFGRLVPHKNVDLLVEAFAQIAAGFPDARLTILGGGSEQARLEALAHERQVGNRVQFLGAVADHEEAFSRLQRASLFVQPSTSEGGGSVAVHEAHACGLPVIAFAHPQGIDRSLIAESVTGFWLGEVGAAPLARLLGELLTAPERIDAMRPLCRNAAAPLDWSLIVSDYEAALLRTIARCQGGSDPLPSAGPGC